MRDEERKAVVVTYIILYNMEERKLRKHDMSWETNTVTSNKAHEEKKCHAYKYETSGDAQRTYKGGQDAVLVMWINKATVEFLEFSDRRTQQEA